MAVKTGVFRKVLSPTIFLSATSKDTAAWGMDSGFDVLITESAGLCKPLFSPIYGAFWPYVSSTTCRACIRPRKIGPMLKFADIVVVTKGDIVSQAEREVFYVQTCGR